MKRSRSAAILLGLLCCCGCYKTFKSHRVVDDTCPFRGTPALVYKQHIATVTWSKSDLDGTPIVTQHFCKLPVLYSVDVVKAPVGKTKGFFEYNEDGSLKKSEAELDQKIPELITSISDTIGNLPQPSGQRNDGSEITFQPELDTAHGHIIDVHLREL